MAKRPKRPAKGKPTQVSEGPFLAMAFLCESVLTEPDTKNQSYIRVFDTFHIEGNATSMPAGIIKCHLVFGMKGMNIPGSHKLNVVMTRPNGEKGSPPAEQRVEFAPGFSGVLSHFELHAILKEPGLHWFDIRIDEKRVARVPLMVSYKRKPLTDAKA